MKEQISKLAKQESVRQLVKYGMVGIVGLTIDIGVFYLLAKVWSIQYPFSTQISEMIGGKISVSVIDADISHIISSILAIINNFMLNSYFTFKVTDNKFKRFLSFAGIAGLGLVVSTTLITFLMNYLHMDEMFSKISSVLVVAALQFGFNKFFTFKRNS